MSDWGAKIIADALKAIAEAIIKAAEILAQRR